MRSGKSLIPVVGAAAAMVLAIELGSAEAQHGLPQRGADSRRPTRLAEMCATAFDKNVATGRGFGMAFVADQNGYPGPLHVLELKDTLGSTLALRQRPCCWT